MFKKIPLLVIIFLMVSSQIFAQAVRGKVISSADGQPLPGVSVVVQFHNVVGGFSPPFERSGGVAGTELEGRA
jgi:hypothetical protein